MGTKVVDGAAIDIARLCCVHSAYLSSKKQSGILKESILRIPVIEHAQSSSWDHEFEFKLENAPKKGTSGAYKKIDVVLAYWNQVIAIEYKFPNENNLNYNDLSNDLEKITKWFPEHKRIAPFPKKYGFIMIVADSSTYGKFNPIGLEEGDIRDETWLKEQTARNHFKINDGFETRCELGSNAYYAKIIKVLDTTIGEEN